MPTLSGDKNDFGKDAVPAVPLTFDRVNEGRPPRTNARLFRSPFEILAIILGYIPSDSLAALALVNSDCLQLARSRQFVSIVLDYSDSSLALIRKLRSETIARAKRTTEPEVRPMPLLGVCIRRVKSKWSQRTIDGTRAFLDGYISSVAAVLNQVSTPNLELLDWGETAVLPPPLFNALAVSSIRHLRLFRVRTDHELAIEPSGTPQPFTWPLQTLHLELPGNIDSSKLSASILRSCASSLEKLFLSSSSRGKPYTFISKDHASLPEFSRLRHLGFGRIDFADASMLEALVTDKIRSLYVCWELHPGFLESRGLVPSLEAFVYEFTLSADDPLRFLRANPQLLKLAFTSALPRSLVESQILPLLSKSFSRLESLSLIWEGKEISESAVQIVGTLQTLRQLHLSAGNRYEWHPDWEIEHRIMRKHLSNLLQLEKLAFSRDSSHRIRTPHEDRLPDGGYDSDETYPDQILWEDRHRKRIRNEASQYVRLMPKLEWLYFGQIPMKVSRSGDNRSRTAVPLLRKRDSCRTLLKKMFGGHFDS